MKVQELINEVNKGEFYGFWNMEIELLGYKGAKESKVAEGLDLDEHRWYSIATNYYKVEDGIVGVRGAYQSFSEMQSWRDIGVICEAFEAEEYTTISYRKKS